jgi:hypothetical protein
MRDWSASADSDGEDATCGYFTGGSALLDLACGFDIRRQVALDFMHLVGGIVGRRLFKLLAGKRTATVSRGAAMDGKMSPAEKKRWADKNAEVKEQLAEWKLTKKDQDEVDRRWLSVTLPDGYGTNYAPFADRTTFTTADWFHLITYAGRWIMDGILEGEQLQVWLRLCRALETLSQHSVKSDPRVHAEMLALIIDTVAFCEKALPPTEQTLQFHNLIHLMEDIIDKGPVHGFWLFR